MLEDLRYLGHGEVGSVRTLQSFSISARKGEEYKRTIIPRGSKAGQVLDEKAGTSAGEEFGAADVKSSGDLQTICGEQRDFPRNAVSCFGDEEFKRGEGDDMVN